MKNMTIKTIATVCGGEIYGTDISDHEVTGVVIDSRKLESGNLFIATRGERVDGHSFIQQVAEKGALAVICEELTETPIPHILVKDSFQALKDIAIFYRKYFDIPVIGITGSVGKTSTKEFIAAVLGVRYKVLKTEGNLNNEIGVPLMVLKIRDEHEVAVLEMGINNFGEMFRLSEIARPTIALLTNIGDCHLENLGDRPGVLRAKSEIFDFLAPDGHVVINGDDVLLVTIPDKNGKPPLRFGIGEENDIYASQVNVMGLDGTSAKINFKESGSSFEIKVPLPGEHMIYGALAASAVGSLLGLNPADIVEGLRGLKSVSGRSNIIRLPKGIIIDDCYNANPVSMKAALQLLKSATGRKVAVLGDMGELGEDKEELHALVGREAVGAEVDVLVCIGTLSINMYNAAKATSDTRFCGLDPQSHNPCEIYHFADKESFLKEAENILNDGDTILLKASRFMAFETLVSALQTNSLFRK